MRIIEGKRKKPNFYDASKKEIYLVAPIEGSKFTFLLRFADVKSVQRNSNEDIR